MRYQAVNLRFLFCVILLSAFQSAALAQPAEDNAQDAWHWLSKMSQAVRTLNYEGTFVYRRGDSLVSMHLVHVKDVHGERERLVTLNGVRREMIRDHNGVKCFLPDENLVVVSNSRLSKALPAKLVENPRAVNTHYDISIAGDGRAMGRSVKVIAIKSKDQYRYGYRVAIDKDTALLLQSDVINENGRIMEQIMFTSLKMLDETPPAFKREGQAAADTVLESLRLVPVKDNSRWGIGRLPDGFRLVDHRSDNRESMRDPRVHHLVITDGLASVSVFIEKQSAPQISSPIVGLSRIGAINAYRTIIEDHQVTVVGEVPVNTVQLIGKSINQRVNR